MDNWLNKTRKRSSILAELGSSSIRTLTDAFGNQVYLKMQIPDYWYFCIK